MTQDEIIEFIRQTEREAWIEAWLEEPINLQIAKLVAAKEREACAKVAERFEPDEKTSYVTYASTAIRARGQA
jgi:hypothetical protein